MIDYIKGEVVELTPTNVTIECGGIGYQLNISLNTYGALNNKPAAKLYVHEVIRDDAHVLFGFMDKHERELFLLLISVSGVGPGTARVILSSLSAKELESVITTENAAVLQSVKGIGAKTAQRIIVDLKDKIIKLNVISDMDLPHHRRPQGQDQMYRRERNHTAPCQSRSFRNRPCRRLGAGDARFCADSLAKSGFKNYQRVAFSASGGCHQRSIEEVIDSGLIT